MLSPALVPHHWFCMFVRRSGGFLSCENVSCAQQAWTKKNQNVRLDKVKCFLIIFKLETGGLLTSKLSLSTNKVFVSI